MVGVLIVTELIAYTDFPNIPDKEFWGLALC